MYLHTELKRKKMNNLSPLDNYQLENVSASIIIDLRRSKQNGDYPVKYRVTFNRKQVYYPCMDLTAEEYSRLHGLVRDLNLKKTKELIKAGFKRITDIIEDLIQKEGFTHEGLARRLKRGMKDSILTAFDNKSADLEKNGKIGTSIWYSGVKKSIEKYARRDIKFSDITVNWLKEYEAHLLKEGKKYTTISINMRALRAVINDGLREGVINQAQYPFVIKNNGKYRIPEGAGRKIALSEEQLYKVFDFTIHPDDEKWRDLWIFSFYCQGVNISDMLRFKYANIKGDYIEWYRGKTISNDKKKIEIRAFITEEMKTIIDRWGNPDKRPSNYIFPYLSHGLSPIEERMIIQNTNHTINKKMKKIGRALGIGDITTYWARHSFASISRYKDVSLFAISKSLGHNSLSTTQIYLDSLSDDELKENAAKLPRRN